MSQNELKTITENNLKWLNSLVSELPDLRFIEPVSQALALINRHNHFTDDEIVIIGTAGLLATKARTVDENKFQEITPGEYFHHAYILLKVFKKEEPCEEEYFNIIKKLV
jgi:hypothetical protein